MFVESKPRTSPTPERSYVRSVNSEIAAHHISPLRGEGRLPSSTTNIQPLRGFPPTSLVGNTPLQRGGAVEPGAPNCFNSFDASSTKPSKRFNAARCSHCTQLKLG